MEMLARCLMKRYGRYVRLPVWRAARRRAPSSFFLILLNEFATNLAGRDITSYTDPQGFMEIS